MARKYREETYHVPVGRGFWGWVRLALLVLLVIILIAAVI
jgi:hypothetical protein